MADVDRAGEHIMRQRDMHGTGGRADHLGQSAAEEMVEIGDAVDRG